MAKKLPERYVEMMDGTILDADAGLAGPDLWIMFHDTRTDIIQGARIFSKEEKTGQMTFRFPGGGKIVYEGYTAPHTLKLDYEGRLQVRMRKPAAINAQAE